MIVNARDLTIVHIVDDDDDVRESLSILLEAHGLQCVLYSSGDEFLSTVKPVDIGCVLLDYYMPGRNGLDTLKALRGIGITMPVIMITAHGDIDLAVNAMKAGAMDFVEKPWDRDVLLNFILRAIETDQDYREILQTKTHAENIVASFTPREKQVFDRLILGEATKVIARKLDLSPRTVEFYRANVLQKADVPSVAGLVRVAFTAGEVLPGL